MLPRNGIEDVARDGDASVEPLRGSGIIHRLTSQALLGLDC